jgi:hypothetical protein
VRLTSKHFIILTIAFYFATLPCAFGNENKTENIIIEKKSSELILNNFLIFPHIGIQIEDRIFADNDAGYVMEPHRIIDLDIFRINNIIFSMFINEFLIYNNNTKQLEPKTINYEMDYANLRWENEYGILSLFTDHNCSNKINGYQPKDSRIRWYGLGMRWESYGMRPGQKDVSHTEVINNLNYRLSFSRAISTKVLNYDYLISGNLRYDIIKYNIFIPYFEGSLTSLIDNRTRFNWGLESGLRMRFEKGDITPFIGVNHKYDIEYYHSKAIDLYFIGLRLETILKNDTDLINKTKYVPKETALFPDFHFRGSYGKYINDDNLNFNTDIFIGIEFLGTYKLSPFIYHTLEHNSQTADSGMFPRYIEQNIESGISYKPAFINALIEPFYRYLRRDEGDYYKGYTQRFSATGLRLISRNMKAGNANKGIDFNKTQNSEQINTVDWSVSAERVFNKFYYNYSWECNILLRWNILRYDKSIPYLSATVRLLIDKESDKIYNAETGVRIQSGLQWILFYRFEYSTAVDPGNGLFKKYNLIGIRFEI